MNGRVALLTGGGRESLHPDIWLAHRTESFDLEGKRKRSMEGAKAWVDRRVTGAGLRASGALSNTR
jgi:hypothetical protein